MENKSEKISTSKVTKWILLIVALLLVGGIFSVNNQQNSGSTTNTQSTPAEFSDTQLNREAREVVLNVLKSPSTAKFSSSRTILKLPNNCFKVSSSVDSQNSFGAMLNSSYEVSFCHTGLDKTNDPYLSPINVTKVIFDGKVVFEK